MKKSEKTKITVAKIINLAIAEFGTNGYTLGTINNICKSGINKGLIYHNFASKEELYLICLKNSCEKFIKYVRETKGEKDLKRYLDIRMDFFHDFPNEAHIIFEALLKPPASLSDRIDEALIEFNILNEHICKKTLETLILRDGITIDDALSYFHLMQTMLNGYFSSPAFQNVVLNEKVRIHEITVQKLFDFMLYGIAEGEKIK